MIVIGIIIIAAVVFVIIVGEAVDMVVVIIIISVVVVIYVVIVVAAAAIRSYLKTSVVGGAGNRDTEAGFGSTRRRESDAGMRRNAARRLKTKKVN